MAFLPENLPRSLRTGLLWIISAYMVAAAAGVEMPWTATSRRLDEWVKAHAEATATIHSLGQDIRILQDREIRHDSEMNRISGKLDEMAMVLYSLERRTR